MTDELCILNNCPSRFKQLSTLSTTTGSFNMQLLLVIKYKNYSNISQNAQKIHFPLPLRLPRKIRLVCVSTIRIFNPNVDYTRVTPSNCAKTHSKKYVRAKSLSPQTLLILNRLAFIKLMLSYEKIHVCRQSLNRSLKEHNHSHIFST